ncbi:TraM recognition domain-containing protein [bacterium]|nr:TraM recognition domain-containing protein [bacterium]
MVGWYRSVGLDEHKALMERAARAREQQGRLSMYRLSRLMLILSVVAGLWSLLILGLKLGGIGYIGIALLLFMLFGKRGFQALTAFGTARWADVADLQAAGMLDAHSGLIIGRVGGWAKPSFQKAMRQLFNSWVPSKEACEQFLASIRVGRKSKLPPPLVRLPKAVHIAVFAPTGVGKGVSAVIPFLLAADESAVIVDFKGENSQITAEHRRKMFGHQIVVLDPFKLVSQAPQTFNPLDFISKDSPTAIDECRDLAEALVIRTGQERDPHWVDSAEAWIAALIALVVYYGEPNDRSLQTVRTLLSSPDKLEMAIKLMCSSDAWDGMLARMGSQLTHFEGKERGSTLTTTSRFLRFLDTLAVSDSTKTSSFNPDDLRRGKTTVYLILPPEHQRAQSPLLRMWIGSLLRAVVRGGLQEQNKVHFVLDEAASLGHMEALDDAVDKYRGYGVRLQFYFQSVSQLRKCFPDGQDQTLLSNVSQVFFGINDLPTAEYVSNRLGEETIVVHSGGTSTGRSQQSSKESLSHTSSSNENANWAQQGRKLLKPDEVLALSDRTVLTFTPGVPPIWTNRIRYFEERNLGQRPGWWQRFTAMANVVIGSVILLLVMSGCLVMVCSQSFR